MKKVLAVTIALLMILSFAACGNKEETPVEEPVVSDTREGYDNLQLSLGSALPSITMWGTYYLNEISDEYAAEGMVASYYTDLASEPDYDFYQWEKGEMTLEDVVTTQFSKHEGLAEVSEYNKFSTWENKNDYEYYHYATFAEYEGKYYIVQSYFFEAEESFIAVDRWNETKEVETNTGDFVMMLPASYREAGYTDETPKELVAAYYDAEQKLPMVYIYSYNSDASTEDFYNELCAQYEVLYSNRLTYTDKDGNTYPGGFLNFKEVEDGETYVESTYFIDLGSQKLRVNFLNFGEGASSAMSVPALYQAIQVK